MSNKLFKQILLMGAVMNATAEQYFDTGRRRVEEKMESLEDRERRERCERMAIEKAKAKRERKAAKRRKDNK